jgi:hypothetical protein
MLLGAVGCIGAWFEKKILLFIVSASFCSILRLEFGLFEVHHHDDYYICHPATGCGIRHCLQRAGRHRIVLASGHHRWVRLQVAATARSELLEHIRRYPGEEAADEHNFRKTMNSIQKRVGGRYSIRCELTVSSSCTAAVSINTKIGSMLMSGLVSPMFLTRAVSRRRLAAASRSPPMKPMV